MNHNITSQQQANQTEFLKNSYNNKQNIKSIGIAILGMLLLLFVLCEPKHIPLIYVKVTSINNTSTFTEFH